MAEAGSTPVAIDSRRVVHETIDGEVILIQLETGFYYTLDGAGAEIWEMLVGGRDPATIACALSESNGDDAAATRATVNGLVRELCSESLLVGDPPVNGVAPAGAASGLTPPVLRKYTDMEDFLLVDPVHEVDDRGWPNVKAGD